MDSPFEECPLPIEGWRLPNQRQGINAMETEKFEPSLWFAYDIPKALGRCSLPTFAL